MSEKDIKLGGAAAKKFAVPANSYSGTTGAYQSSDQVRSFYYQQQGETATSSSSLPDGWEQRQQARESDSKQHMAFAPPPSNKAATNEGPGINESCEDTMIIPELTILRLTTHSLQALAETLEQRPVKVPMKDRAAFAAAMKQAMDSLAKSV